MAFPTDLDNLTNPTISDKLNNPDHATQHANTNDAIEAIEAKVGTGASTPVADSFLIGNGTGTSAWSALTSAQLRARLSDETGTGAAVFANTPALVTPDIGVATGTSLALGGGAALTTTARTGTGDLVLASSPTIVTPTVASFANSNHDHSNSAGGGTLTHTAFPAGAVVQVVRSMSSAVATGTATIPLDDTIPQNTEGDEYMTLAITPKSTTNILVIQVVALLSNSGASNHEAVALFQDTTADALAATEHLMGADSPATVTLTHALVAGTTSATTFKVRAGSNAAGTTTFNGRSAARLYGAITKSSIVITEYKSS